MQLSISQIVRRLGKVTSTDIDRPDRPISSLICDSRELIDAPHTLFFALRTPCGDGHAFIADLYRHGVRNFVVNTDYKPCSERRDANFFRVGSPLSALQSLAAAIRAEHPSMTTVGITGSRGKTQIKEMISSLLSPGAPTVCSPRSFNSQTGVPLSIWEVADDTRIGLFEAGISLPGEMQTLEPLIRPEIGVFTCLTDEHGENFTSNEQKAREKALLFRHSRIVFYPEGCEMIARAISAVNPDAELVPTAPDLRSMARAVAAEAARMAGTPLPDENAPLEVISTRIDVLQALKDCLIIYDGFTHDLRSTSEALCFMKKRATASRSATLILAPLPQPGDYFALAPQLADAGVKRLIMVGSAPENALSDLQRGVSHIDFATDYLDFINRFSISDFQSELILVKGTPALGFDSIASHLEAPRHETILEVNLCALIHNYNYFKSLLPSSSRLITMVKADAYGTGALEVSKTMQSQGAAALAVAVVDEGITLRQAGITMPVIVMNPMGTNYKALFDFRLEPSVFSLRELDTLLHYAEIYDVHDYPVHIKLDTGMHRLGFLSSELDTLILRLKNQSRLKAASVFSHLATADCLDQDAYTESQKTLFTQGADRLTAALPQPLKRHLLNTAGIIRFPDFPSDLARLGIGLYGLSPLPPEVPVQLQNVASLTTTIISLRTWQKGTTIGYSRRGLISRRSIIATIPIGYADGFDRRLGNGHTTVRVNGIDCPTVGNICMDQCMIDVTEANAAPGDKVTIFDSAADILRLAATLGTISYEILTSISPRVKRIYFRE